MNGILLMKSGSEAATPTHLIKSILFGGLTRTKEAIELGIQSRTLKQLVQQKWLE